MISSDPGTYALILCARSSSNVDVRIGRLGEARLEPGVYVYVGSALGPGGLRARLGHHARVALRPRPHWHVDWLRAHAAWVGLWYAYDTRRREHDWADAMASARGARVWLPRFGASDCRCATHLVHFERPPTRRSFVRRLRSRVRDHPIVHGRTIDDVSLLERACTAGDSDCRDGYVNL